MHAMDLMRDQKHQVLRNRETNESDHLRNQVVLEMLNHLVTCDLWIPMHHKDVSLIHPIKESLLRGVCGIVWPMAPLGFKLLI